MIIINIIPGDRTRNVEHQRDSRTRTQYILLFEVMHYNLTNVAESITFLVKYVNSVREKTRWDIYYIYGVSSDYIQRYSRLNLGFFSSSAKKNPWG